MPVFLSINYLLEKKGDAFKFQKSCCFHFSGTASGTTGWWMDGQDNLKL